MLRRCESRTVEDSLQFHMKVHMRKHLKGNISEPEYIRVKKKKTLKCKVFFFKTRTSEKQSVQEEADS